MHVPGPGRRGLVVRVRPPGGRSRGPPIIHLPLRAHSQLEPAGNSSVPSCFRDQRGPMNPATLTFLRSQVRTPHRLWSPVTTAANRDGSLFKDSHGRVRSNQTHDAAEPNLPQRSPAPLIPGGRAFQIQ
jgi:hypothetical protein